MPRLTRGPFEWMFGVFEGSRLAAWVLLLLCCKLAIYVADMTSSVVPQTILVSVAAPFMIIAGGESTSDGDQKA
ncbi:hypothetical protein C2E23DRAFT_904743, partial [Lenzites betulinus]